MDCRNVKRKQIKSLKTQARALNTAILFVVYLIFSSGSSVFIPKYSGILSGSAPVSAISRRSAAFSSVTLGAYFGRLPPFEHRVLKFSPAFYADFLFSNGYC